MDAQLAELDTRVAALEAQVVALSAMVARLEREPQILHRDASTGQFVSAEDAAADPDGTVRERR